MSFSGHRFLQPTYVVCCLSLVPNNCRVTSLEHRVINVRHWHLPASRCAGQWGARSEYTPNGTLRNWLSCRAVARVLAITILWDTWGLSGDTETGSPIRLAGWGRRKQGASSRSGRAGEGGVLGGGAGMCKREWNHCSGNMTGDEYD